MSIFVSVGIVILAMVIMLFMQLSSGILALLCHYTSGKYSKRKLSNLSIFYILGAEIINACLLLSFFYITYIIFMTTPQPETSIFAWIAAGIFIILAITSFICYFRKGPGTKLFIPRKVANTLDHHARKAKTRSDAFVLGAFSGVYELPFTIPLYIALAIELSIINTEYFSTNPLLILCIIIPIIPLFIVRWLFQSGHNLADIMRIRAKNKIFTKIIISLSYLTIALLIIFFRINIA